jgi:hypothetical protein
VELNAEPLVDCGRPNHGPAAATVGHINSYCAKVPAKGSAMATLISVLITFVVVILVLYLVNMLPIEGRAKHIVRIIVIIIGILSLLRYLSVS